MLRYPLLQLTTLLVLAACSEKSGSGGADSGGESSDSADPGLDSGDDTGTGPDTGDDPEDLSDWINTTALPTGDLDCFTGSLGSEEVAPGCAGHEPLVTTAVSDFQSSAPVRDATIEIFLGDDVGGPVDHSSVTGSGGQSSVRLPTCTSFSFRVSTDATWGSTKPTIGAHEVLPFSSSDTAHHALPSMSASTYALIPSIVGIAPEPTRGLVMGRATDCTGDPIAGLQVVVRNASGNIPDGTTAHYFDDGLPSTAQTETSADGRWLLLNVPPGKVTIEGHVYNGSGHTQIAENLIVVQADSAHIAPLYVGLGDGVKLPDSCLTSCE
jgi:hypothetical protein